MSKGKKIEVLETEINIVSVNEQDYISLTDMLKAKDGDFFISDWLRNRNTVELSGGAFQPGLCQGQWRYF